MQKGKNVIKDIILVLFLIFSNHTFSQKEKLNGKYSQLASFQEHYNFYVFDKNGEFQYHTGASLGDDYFGNGTYKFVDNLLILNYNKTEPIKIGHHVSKIWTNNRDSITLQFNVFDFNNLPLPAVSVIYKDSLSRHGYSGVASNDKGVAHLNFKKSRTDLQVEISNLGFVPYKFSLDKTYNYDIAIFLQKDGNGLPIRNQIDTLQIVKIKPKYFTVRNKNGSETTWQKRED